MLRVPFYTLANYSQIISSPYDASSAQQREDRWQFVHLLRSGYRRRYQDVDARKLDEYLSTHPQTGSISLGTQQLPRRDVLIAGKLLMPSLRTSKYFFRRPGQANHGGIDIMLPFLTPIPSFTAGQVVKIKQRDGSSQDEGNCVVIKATDGHYLSYQHLETVTVSHGQHVTQHTTIGRCGTTGNSTQFHLHLQVETPSAPRHPFWSASLPTLQHYTIDPLPYLQAHAPDCPFVDMPPHQDYLEAIWALYELGIIQGHGGHVYPQRTLKRYEMALLIDRILSKLNLYDQLTVLQPVYTPYTDIDLHDPELDVALQRLQRYGIMKGHQDQFFPLIELKGEELLALLGRIFYQLSDSETTPRYQTYLQQFDQAGIISASWPYISRPVPRAEVCLVIHQTLQQQSTPT